MSEVTELLTAYRRGELTLEELAQRFQQRTWPPRRPSPRTAREVWQREMEDPEPVQENSSRIFRMYTESGRWDLSGSASWPPLVLR